MEKEENVDGETTITGQDEDGKQDGAISARPKESPTVLGKFKDVDALARAYEALQSEFTRRSQRLKELEKKVENFEGKPTTEKTEGSGVEKLRKNAKSRREQEKAFDAFVAQVEKDSEKKGNTDKPTLQATDAENIATFGQGENRGEQEETLKFSTEDKRLQKGDTTVEFKDNSALENSAEEREKLEGVSTSSGEKNGEVLPSVAEGEDKKTPSEELYRRVCEDEEVRLRIIGEYLTSINRYAVPLTAHGGGTLATPPIKPTSIVGAGEMALRYLKNSKSGK